MNKKYMMSAEYFAREDRTQEIAKNMIQKGTDASFISDVTGLKQSDIEKLV